MSSSPDEYASITEEVIRDISEKKVHFNLAFSWAAHRRGIFHGENAQQYNFLFRQVHRRFKRKNREALSQSLQGERPWQHGKIKREPKPPKPPNKVGRSRLKPGIEVEADEWPYLTPPPLL